MTIIHGKLRLAAGDVLDIPPKIAEKWLKIDGVEKYADPEKVEQLEKKLEKAEAELKKKAKAKE